MSKRGRQDDQESVTHAIELLCCRTPAKAEVEGVSLTPLEQQVVSLKESIAPQVVLMVACGYRVKFYGADSRAVSRRVGILCIPGQPFEYSSFPYTRVDLYVHRLVAMGYQVGFADQESAAMRAADGLKSGLFTRTVSQLYSRATLLPTEHVVTNGSANNTAYHSGGGGRAGPLPSSSPSSKATAAEDAEGEEEDDTDGAEGEVVAPRAATASGTVDASELFLCFLSTEDTTSAFDAVVDVDVDGGTSATSATRTPPMTVVLVSFVTQRRLRLTVRTALELEDITQRFDIAELVVLTRRAPPQLKSGGSSGTAVQQQQQQQPPQRSTAPFLALLPEVYSGALQHTLALHFGPTANGEEDDKAVTVSGYVCARGQDVEAAIAAYLQPFKLDQVYHMLCKRVGTATIDLDASPLTSSQEPLQQPSLSQAGETAAHLHLPGPTLRALDVFHSSIGHRGSLLGLLERSLTACGARCLRRWLAAPLCSRPAIAARQAVTQYLAAGSDEGQVEEMLRECARLGDVEAVVGKLHAERCHVVEFARLLRMVRGVAALAHQLCVEPKDINEEEEEEEGGEANGCRRSPPPLLQALLCAVSGAAVTTLLNANTALLQTTARTPLEFFTEGSQTVPDSLRVHWEARAAAEAALEAELCAARSLLNLPGLEYRTIAGTSYLLDVPQGKCGRVPSSWVVQTRTKTNVRYHTPVITEQQIARTAATERLALAAAAAWRQHQREVVADAAVMAALGGVVEAIGSLDALHSLAVASRQPGYVMPRLIDLPGSNNNTVPHAAAAAAAEVTTESVSLSIKEGRHPILDRLLHHGYVSCDVELRAGGAWLLTGPNMGGKSALMRMVGTFVVLAQIGCAVPAEAATMPVFRGVYCRMGASDSILEGSSTFLSEMDETSRILRTPDLHASLVLMDELGRGTSSFDGAAVAAATLEYLLQQHATTMFVTHYSYLCDPYLSAAASSSPSAEKDEGGGVQCYFMGFRETEAVAGDAATTRLVFTYKPCRGVTPSSFGVAIGRKAGLPAAVTEAAREVSAAAEEAHRVKHDFQELRRLVNGEAV